MVQFVAPIWMLLPMIEPLMLKFVPLAAMRPLGANTAPVQVRSCEPSWMAFELVVVADEHDFGVAVAGVVEEPGEFAGPDHGGFVDNDDRAA